jgi:hypothetical protein
VPLPHMEQMKADQIQARILETSTLKSIRVDSRAFAAEDFLI